ncbi:MAG: hypothetical protein WBD58_05575 [Geitlerinemataceae cyanobacterium]
MTHSKIAIGTTLVMSQSIASAAASTVGIAKTGTAIGTLQGAAQMTATTAWIGFGSTQVGLFLMTACPLLGVWLVVDGIVQSSRKISQKNSHDIDRQIANIFNENLRQVHIERANRERIEFWRSRGIEVK